LSWGEGVITMAMIGKVKRMYFRQKKSVREIVRPTSLSRNTVRKWLEASVLGEPRYRRSPAPGKLSAFHDAIKLALKADAQIRSESYAGSHSRVTDFVRAWRQGEGQSVSTTAFVPLAFELGEAFQFDWSEEGLVVGGIYYRMQVSHLKLRVSRAFWLVAYPSQGHEMLFDAHTRSFAAMGGMARRGIYECKGLPCS
jgi:transposase